MANPYQSPLSPNSEPRKSWAGRVFGTFLLVLAVFVWAPMTVAPLVAAVHEPQKQLWVKIGAAAFNALVMVVLFCLGRRLRGVKKTADTAAENL